jgi:hypothetical protein
LPDGSSVAVRRAVVRIVIGALALRLISAILALYVNLSFPLQQREQFTVFDSTSPFWDTFARYDSGWYQQIATNGYGFVKGGPSVGVGKPGKIAFFPLYPVSMQYASRLFGSSKADVYMAGILVSWISFIVASVGLYYLARLDLDPLQAERAVTLTAIFPFSFFFGLVYTEALFLMLTVFSFYGFRTRRWALGGIAGALATATRANGIFMLPALAWLAYRAAQPTARDRALAALGLVLVASGVGAYSLYIYQLSGNPFEWAMTIQRWGYHLGGPPWTAPFRLMGELLTHPYQYLINDPMARYDTLYGITAIAFLIMTPFVWVKFGAAYGIFMLLNLLVPLSSGVFEGLGRYCSVLFPAFILLATIRSQAISTGIVVIFAMFYTLGLALFTSIHPIF